VRTHRTEGEHPHSAGARQSTDAANVKLLIDNAVSARISRGVIFRRYGKDISGVDIITIIIIIIIGFYSSNSETYVDKTEELN